MMNFENFKMEVEKRFVNYLSEDLREMEVKVTPVYKTNVVRHAVVLVCSADKIHVSPTLYMEDMYGEYENTGDFEAVMQHAARKMEAVFAKIPDIGAINFAEAGQNIVFQLINTKQNEDFLSAVPHREFLDLSIIYRWVIKMDTDGIQSTVIKNSMADSLGLDEEQLFKLASDNTRRILPPEIESISKYARQMLVYEGVPEDEIDEIMMSMHDTHDDLLKVGNIRHHWGAATIIEEKILYELAEKLGDDLFILPSSIHECLATRAFNKEPYELAEMVTCVNSEAVLPEERLSNNVYFYSRKERKLSLATNNPCIWDK